MSTEQNVTDELLEDTAAGYDPNAYNPAAVADQMKAVIAQAKRDGRSKEQMGELYIMRSSAAHLERGGDGPEYQLEMDKYRYLMENWDKV